MTSDIDVLIPTGGQRLHNCAFQINAVLSSNANARAIVLLSDSWPELMQRFTAIDTNRIKFVIPPVASGLPNDGHAPLYSERGFLGLPKVKWALENLDLAPWFGYFHDDDALMPWGLEALMDATKLTGISMVVGRALAVSRREHLDFSLYTVGRSLDRCRVSNACAIYKTAALKSLPRPWYEPRYLYADWELINRMARFFPYTMIPTVVSAVTLYEREQLPIDILSQIDERLNDGVSRNLVEEAAACAIRPC